MYDVKYGISLVEEQFLTAVVAKCYNHSDYAGNVSQPVGQAVFVSRSPDGGCNE